MLQVKHAGSIKDARPYARHANTIKPVKEVWVKFNNTLSRVWTAFTASISSSPEDFYAYAPDGNVYLSVQVTVEGAAPISYNWSVASAPNLSVSGSGAVRNLVMGGSGNTSISIPVTCVVTDANGNTATLSATCTMSRGILA